MGNERLIELAREVLPFAYAPYSGYRVGAALLAGDGQVFRGVNVENASYGLTLCAERAALAAALTAGIRSFTLLAIATGGAGVPLPCGACRQVLSEFAPALTILVAPSTAPVQSFTLEELLPHSFRLTSPERLFQACKGDNR